MYKIKVYYKTGDSFHTKDTHTILEPTWKNLEIAKENLQRLKEHYKIEKEYSRICFNNDAEDKFISSGLPSFIKIEKRHHLLCMTLRLDNDNELQFYPCWCGYFEQLQWAEIIADKDSGMYFEI